MYPPPQPAVAVSRPATEEHHKLGAGLLNHIRHHPPTQPFSYEYILEEGKLPVLAEFHPKPREHLPTRTLSQPKAQPSSTMFRSKSLRRPEKNLQFDISSYQIQQPPQERTSDKLKRAFSFSGMRSSSQSRRNASKSHIKHVPPVPQRALTLIPPPAPESRVPSLVLPTPSPSPEPTRDSYSSNHKAPINYSLPRSSWASYDDDYDMAFLRESAFGRLSPTPFHTTELRRDKALAMLGITDMPLSPPYTPATSTAPSVRDYHSRTSSRRPSTETRRSQYIPKPEEPKQSPEVQSLATQETPKPAKQEQKQTPQEQESPLATPRPQPLRRKTSKFIEHLDMHAEKLSLPISAPLVLLSEPRSAIERTTTITIIGEPQARYAPPIRRSVSMKTPSPTPSTWGAVVCTAQARPIVAAGHARMIHS